MKFKFKYFRVFAANFFLISSICFGAETKQDNPYLIKTFIDPSGKKIDQIIVPASPPEYTMPIAEPPIARMVGGKMAANTLNNVPAFTWCYGCSATSAAMMMGYYDNSSSFPNIYTGPANGGVCPMNNVTFWGSTTYPGGKCGECPISVSHNGIDGRTTRGHVGDYWVDIESTQPDPYITGSWATHSNDSLGDFMWTNRSAKKNVDGSTIFFYDNLGDPLYDYSGNEPGKRDGCHGIKLFVEYCGYSVESQGNYNQYIYGYEGRTKGFTFENYKSEIDAGRPVLIHVSGHTMLGFGYDNTGQKVYLRDTWDHNSHEMVWGDKYGTRQHYAVTVIKLSGSVPPSPSSLVIDKLKGKINWKNSPCIGSDTIKCSMQTTLTDLSFLENCNNMSDFFTMDSGAGTVTGSSGEFLKINGKKNKVIMKLKTSSGYFVKTIMKLKNNQLTVTRKMKNGDASDVKFDVSNTDCDWQTKNVNVKLKCSYGGTTITNSGTRTINYKTKADKKTIIK